MNLYLKVKKIFGIGEIGLDYHWMKHSREKQMKLFESQIEIAKKYDLPIVVHNRDAFEDTYYILKGMDCKRVIIHCFSGNVEIAKKFLNLGYYISFAGNVTFKKATELQEALKFIPIDQLLLETDCPFLTPVPNRGKKTDRIMYVLFMNLLLKYVMLSLKRFNKVYILILNI
jgi:TatD DNase family protein